MNIRPICNDADYKAKLREMSAYFDDQPKRKTKEGDRFEILLTLVDAYEAKQFPMDLPDPIDAIKFRMDQQGLTPKDLPLAFSDQGFEPFVKRLNFIAVG